MKQEQLEAFLSSVSAVVTEDGWSEVPAEQHITLYAAHDGVGLTISKVEAIKPDGELVRARTRKGETYQVALSDLFAAAVEAPKNGERKAGFAADR
jgi:hypothetical protein